MKNKLDLVLTKNIPWLKVLLDIKIRKRMSKITGTLIFLKKIQKNLV